MRAIIAQRMVESVAISPHVYTVYKVDMTRIMRLREREKSRFEQKHGVKLTYMPFIAVAAVEALRKFPIVNASLEDGSIHYHANINLGIAVALEWGLIVPVIKQAEQRSFAEIAARHERPRRPRPRQEAAARRGCGRHVHAHQLRRLRRRVWHPHHQPARVGDPGHRRVAKEPVVLTDADGNDSIAIRSMQHFCLGFDHRPSTAQTPASS